MKPRDLQGETEDYWRMVDEIACRHPRRSWIDDTRRQTDGSLLRKCGVCGHQWKAAGDIKYRATRREDLSK